MAYKNFTHTEKITRLAQLANGRRVLFVAPKATGPTGGVRVIVEHAETLQKFGVNVGVVAPFSRDKSDVLCNGATVVPIHAGPFQKRKGDVFVWSEIFKPHQIRFSLGSNIETVIFVQSFLYAFRAFPNANEVSSMQLSQVIAASRHVQKFLENFCGLSEVPIIPASVKKWNGEMSSKRDIIVYMPQKRLAESVFIKKMLQSCFPSSLLYEWQEISGLMHTEVLKILADARIFLSLQRFDGFGLPALEAMAAGCLVTGFNGQGGAEYANEKNGFWVKEDDIIGAAHSLAKAIWILRERPEEAAVMIASGQQAASLYTETARDTAVCEVYSKILSKQNVVN